MAVANLKPTDIVFHLGCGDARLLIAAEKKYHCQTIGFELALIPYLLALIRKFLSKSKSQIHFHNFFNTPLNKATVIFCYLTPNVLKKLAPKLKTDCQPGTRVISHTFHIEGLTKNQIFSRDESKKIPTIYLYQI